MTNRKAVPSLGIFSTGALLAMLAVGGCNALQTETGEQNSTITQSARLQAAADIIVDPRRSLVVTEQVILARFPFQRVMNQLVAQSGVAGVTSLSLFNQWWDTQNPAPGLGTGPHCDDQLDSNNQPQINGYPYTCRASPSEGAQANVDPFATNPDGGLNPDSYFPIGLFNRFDIAPADGSHCGEYRIVYAKTSGIAANNQRNLVIFEAVLPNPHPQQGLKGCKKVAKFWADLSNEDDINARADELEHFYFDGLSPYAPVVHVDHFGNVPPSGQIRTNQFISSGQWSLREFLLLRTCTGASCSSLRFVPVTNKLNPFGPLFSSTFPHANKAAFQSFFPTQVADLAVNDLVGFNYELSDVYNTAQSQASGSAENNYRLQFAGTDGGTFRANLEAALVDAGSTLTPEEIVMRAQALSCAGCHRLNNNQPLGGGLVWPPSLGFTHINERVTENSDAGTRFPISPALNDVFLPHRKEVLEDYVNKEKIKKVKKVKDSIGGSKTH